MYTVIELCKLRARCWQHAKNAAAQHDSNKHHYWWEHAAKLSKHIAS